MQNVNKKEQNDYLCHILHIQHQEFPIFNVFLTIYNFGKIQDGAQNGSILDDVTGPSAARQPIICTSPCKAHHRLSLKVKYCNIRPSVNTLN